MRWLRSLFVQLRSRLAVSCCLTSRSFRLRAAVQLAGPGQLARPGPDNTILAGLYYASISAVGGPAPLELADPKAGRSEGRRRPAPMCCRSALPP